MGYRVAVVGATGSVGREMMVILEELQFPVDEIYALASRKSIGMEVNYGDRVLYAQALDQFDFSKVDIVLMSAGKKVSLEWSEKIGRAGPVVMAEMPAMMGRSFDRFCDKTQCSADERAALAKVVDGMKAKMAARSS